MGNPWPGWGMDGKTPLRHKRVRMLWCRISEGVCYWGAGGSGVCLGAAECCRDWSASSSNGSGAGHVEQHCLAQAQQCSAPLPPSSPFFSSSFPLFFPCPCSFPSPSPFPSSICPSSSPLPPTPFLTSSLFLLLHFLSFLFFPSSFFSFLPSSLSFLSSLFFPDHRATQAPFSLQEAVWEQTPAAVMGTGMPFWGNHLQSPQELPGGTSPVLHKSPWNHGSVLPATEPVLLWLCVGPSTPSAPDVIYSHHCESLFCFEESQGQRGGKGPLKVT